MNIISALNKHIVWGKYSVSVVSLIIFILGSLAAIIKISQGANHINNYLIFEGVYHHLTTQQNLYSQYPLEYLDKNHYGPLFSVLIGPFAILPVWAGCLLWCMTNAVIFIYAIKRLPFENKNTDVILLICIFELIAAIQNVQSNPLLAASIILAFLCIQKQNIFWATFFIASGFLVKLYGIAGLLFFLFADNKLRFILYFLFWMLVLFFLPMLISSPEFVIQSYHDWISALTNKNHSNATSDMQNMSAMRVFDLIAGKKIPYSIYLGIAVILFHIPLVRMRYWRSLRYRLLYLSWILITVVLFSSSAEGATYIIAIAGAAIWFTTQCSRIGSWEFWVLVLVIIFGSASATDLVPYYLKVTLIRPYGIKVMPYILVWGIIWWQLSFSPASFFKSFSCVKTLP